MPGNIRTDHLTHRTGPAAGTPDSGAVVIYAKSDGEYYKKDDLGNEVAFLTDISASGGDKELDADTADAWKVTQSSDAYMKFGTATAGRIAVFGNKSFDLQTDILAGASGMTLDSGGAAVVDAAGAVEINSSAGSILIGNDAINQNVGLGTGGDRTITVGTAATRAVVNTAAGDLTLQSDSESLWTVKANKAQAWKLDDGANDYLLVATTTGSEAMSFGNTVLNPAYNFLGSGLATFSGPADFDDSLTVSGTGSYGQTAGGFTYNVTGSNFNVQACAAFAVTANNGTASAISLEATAAGGVGITAGTAGYAVISAGPVKFEGPDNNSSMWGVWEGANPYVVCDSTNTSELVTIYKALDVEAVLHAKQGVDVDGPLTTKMGVASGDSMLIGGQLYSNIDTSTAITNTLSETDFDTKKVIAGGTLVPGRIIHLNASVNVTGVAGTDGLDLRLKLGAAELVLVQQNTATAAMTALFDLTIHILDGGGAASNRAVLVYGSVFFAAPGGSMLAHRVLVASVDVSGDLDLRLTAEWEAAQVGNTVICESFSVSVE